MLTPIDVKLPSSFAFFSRTNSRHFVRYQKGPPNLVNASWLYTISLAWGSCQTEMENILSELQLTIIPRGRMGY